MIGIPIGLAVANASEWLVHKYVLHGLGRDKKSFWSFHWHDHHRNVRKHGHVDPDYKEPLLSKWNGQSKEAVALVASAAALAPLFPVAPFFVGTMTYCAVNYYRKHKRAHLDPEWARKHLPWHYDHHMGPDQDANWCVTRPWFDHVMGTRKPYVGTEREARERERRARRAATAAAPQSVAI
jgi:sterol desaturase/sphingolipid hydroxylase (fatty acid hydroxylase superfamily)